MQPSPEAVRPEGAGLLAVRPLSGPAPVGRGLKTCRKFSPAGIAGRVRSCAAGVKTVLRSADFRMRVTARGKVVLCEALVTKCASGSALRFIVVDAE